MVEVLSFCGRTLSVSPAAVRSYESLLMSQTVPTESEIVDKAEQVAAKGIGKGTLSLSIPLLAALGADVMGEFAAWRDLADTNAKGSLYLMGRRFDDLEWMVTTVGLSDPMAGPGGTVYQGKLQLGFDGALPVEEAAKKSGKGNGNGNGNGGGNGSGEGAGYHLDQSGYIRRMQGSYTQEQREELWRSMLWQSRQLPERSTADGWAPGRVVK